MVRPVSRKSFYFAPKMSREVVHIVDISGGVQRGRWDNGWSELDRVVYPIPG